MASHQGFLSSLTPFALVLALAPAVGCGLINVNGKPLGGGSTPAGASNGEPSTGDGDGASASRASGPAAGKPMNTKRIDDVKPPEPSAPLSTWTAAQQWMPHDKWGGDFGYRSLAGGVALADELGDQLSALGRISLVDKCFRNLKEDATSSLAWAVCGDDVAAVDLKRAEAELTAEGIGPASRDEVMAHAREVVDAARKIGAAVEATAKDDPGVDKLIKLRAAAREEWTAYAAAHKDAITRFLTLKDAVRSGKSNDKRYAGCYEQTQPAFAKLVHTTKFPAGVRGDPMPGYVQFVTATTDGYITTVAYAACAFGQDAAGEAIYAAAADPRGGGARFGTRSITLAKALDPAFKPGFADRALSLDNMAFQWKYGLAMPGAGETTAIMTPSSGIVASLKAGDGTTTKISFKGNTVEECLEWVDTNRISQVSPNGTISYQKNCKRRGQVANQTTAVDVPSKYLGGVSPGVNIVTVHQFPVVAWKGNQLTGVLGVAK
jgi:hypothetical protein